jgi:hypothetical protein
MPRFCKNCGVDAPNAGQCGDVAGVRHVFIEGNSTHFNDFIIFEFILMRFSFSLRSGCGVPKKEDLNFKFLVLLKLKFLFCLYVFDNE